ncbi:capsid protein 1 [Chaphamaparvovirus chiropteran1]|uniref:Capsid protein 1 n=1 Tax=Desmodus rotundus parvovirus TaxID=1926498 RepID=A0A1L4AJD0_9VIRU|nr:capsid protein 1 [Desmodus rotundus parvovirus]API68924.1 capsid protein 1 [Desmodus rotundus parvovirus]
MAEDVSYTNTYMAYWKNGPYIYPNNDTDPKSKTGQVMSTGEINTGWHIIPTILWKHFTTPKQWCNFMIKYEAYTVKGYTVTVYNPIPMTQQLAIQGTTAFTAFNNTIYTLGAQDDIYETSYHNWYLDTPFNHFNLAYKEGQYKDNNNSWNKTVFPVYSWRTANPRNVSDTTYSYIPTVLSYSTWPRVANESDIPNGLFWDPLTDPDSIMELRPGKNSMSFSWNAHDCDTNKWYNLDCIAKWTPYVHDNPFQHIGRAGQAGSYKITTTDDPDPLSTYSSWATTELTKDDFTIPNLLNMPVVPMNWWWQEMQKSIAQTTTLKKPALFWAGTEYEQYKYPPTQCFLKGVPLFDDNGTHVETLTQGCFRVTLHLAAKKRRSRIFAPTWGPLAWTQIYSIDAPRAPNAVRYRTGGARRTWTNIEKESGESPYNIREDPYSTSTTYDRSITSNTETISKPQIRYRQMVNKRDRTAETAVTMMDLQLPPNL